MTPPILVSGPVPTCLRRAFRAPGLSGQLQGLGDEQRATSAVKQVSLLYHRKFIPVELGTLGPRLLEGKMNALARLGKAYRRLALLEAQSFLDGLKTSLRAG